MWPCSKFSYADILHHLYDKQFVALIRQINFRWSRWAKHGSIALKRALALILNEMMKRNSCFAEKAAIFDKVVSPGWIITLLLKQTTHSFETCFSNKAKIYGRIHVIIQSYSPVNDIQPVEVFQSEEDLPGVKPCAVFVESAHFINVGQKFAVFGVGEDEIQAIRILESAVQFDEEGGACWRKGVQDVSFAFHVFSLFLADDVPFLAHFDCKGRGEK